MGNFINVILLFSTNLIFTNYFFQRFEQSDITIALQGLNNFSEDLLDIGYPVNIELNYYLFSVLISFLSTFLTYITIFSIRLFERPQNFLKVISYLFFINAVSLFSTLYIFRFFNFPRADILLNLILYPLVFFIVFLIFQKDLVNRFNKVNKYLYPVFIFFIYGFLVFTLYQQNIDPSLSTEYSDNVVEDSDDSFEDTIEVAIPLPESDDQLCYKWSGSANYMGCDFVTSLVKINSFENRSVTNFVTFNSDLYIVLNDGKILKNNKIFLDISEKVLTGYSETGLYDIEFHPNENYFLVSYANIENMLVVEKFSFQTNGDILTNEIIFEKPNSKFNHYCGSLDWSDSFNSFLFCIGDMGDPNSSLSTTSMNGKIVLINTESNFTPVNISSESNSTVLNNFIVYGLRNPWNFIEYENIMIIPDVGEKSNEELNIIELNDLKNSSEPYLFGWPILEGSIKYEKSSYGLKIWDDGYPDLYDYVLEKSITPKVYYDRPAPENNRVAILGTSIYENKNSKFYKNVIFADYLSKELFAYNYENDELFVLNLPYFPGYMTAIGNHPKDSTKLLFSTSNNGNSEVYEVQLP